MNMIRNMGCGGVQVMFDDCAADSVCAAAYPDLEAQLYRVIRKLNAKPRPARPPHKTAYMPLLIDQVDQGKTDLLLPWLDDELHGRYPSSLFVWGLYFAVNCQDDAPSATPEAMAAQTAVYPQLDGYVRSAC